MKKRTMIVLSACSLALHFLPLTAKAQDKATFICFPGNEVLPADKINSVLKTWGGPD